MTTDPITGTPAPNPHAPYDEAQAARAKAIREAAQILTGTAVAYPPGGYGTGHSGLPETRHAFEVISLADYIVRGQVDGSLTYLDVALEGEDPGDDGEGAGVPADPRVPLTPAQEAAAKEDFRQFREGLAEAGITLRHTPRQIMTDALGKLAEAEARS